METVTVDRWLYSVLHSDATLMGLATDVHGWPVPPNAVLPYVLFQEQTSRDEQGMGPTRLWVRGLWIVRAVFETRDWGGNLEAAANRIDALLHAQGGTVSSGQVFVCVREGPFRLIENVQSRQFRHLGGYYRCIAR